jgi:hypothetical protein
MRTIVWKTCLIALRSMTFPAIMGNGESFISCFDLNFLNFKLISGQTTDGLMERGLKEMRTAIHQPNRSTLGRFKQRRLFEVGF